jgi:hypothetical protein
VPITAISSRLRRGTRAEAQGLRFFGQSQTVIRSRPLAVAGSMLARLGLIDAVAAWPDACNPTVALNLRDTSSQAWMAPLIPTRARALRLEPRAWQAVRARALVIPHGQSLLVPAAERGLGRALHTPHVSLYSPGGSVSKLTCFISESEAETPAAVVKAMARRSDAWWLRSEVDKLSRLRARLSGETLRALLQPPLLAEEMDEEYLVVEAYARLQEEGDRSPRMSARAHAWLRDFQGSTTRARDRWQEQDTSAVLGAVAIAWSLLRPDTAGPLLEWDEQTLGSLRGAPLPRCATHGDFAPGNLAESGGQLKVLDWEWSTLDGAPYFDLWSYQLAELHRRLCDTGEEGFDEHMEQALAFVEGELAGAEVDPAFALATLPVVLSELVVRVRRTLGRAGIWERCSEQLMAAVERLIARRARPLARRLAIDA